MQVLWTPIPWMNIGMGSGCFHITLFLPRVSATAVIILKDKWSHFCAQMKSEQLSTNIKELLKGTKKSLFLFLP